MMSNSASSNNIKSLWKLHNANLTLLVLLMVFIGYSLFIAINLKPGIIPDEPAHFAFSKHFSTTLGIPPDTIETYSWGWYIEQNPFLYYWITGRIINFINLFSPNLADQTLLISLRIVSIFYAVGTVFFCFLLSREVIQNKWWQLLPVFLLTNTLMFVFVAPGVHYDSLANLFSMAGLYYLVRVLKKKPFISNSLDWMIFIALGTLVKYTILPLALIMAICWIIYIFLHRHSIFPIQLRNIKSTLLLSLLVLLLVGNFAIYGVNLIRYRSVTPKCREILLESQCEISKYEERHDKLALDEKLTIRESISQGYPSPIRYILVDWGYHLILRTFGISGHLAYFPYHLIRYYQVLFYGLFLLGILNFLFQRTISYTAINLLAIAAFYALVLFIKNYNSELVYGFKQVAIQGRYFFPVIGAHFVLLTLVIKNTPIRILQYLTLAGLLGLIFYGGPITLILNYQTVFATWFL
mgnify:CR=1 FL=1